MKLNKLKKNIIKSFLNRYRFWILGVFLIGVFSNLLTILIPISIGKYYDLLFGYSSKRAVILDFLPNRWTDTLPHFLVFFIFLVLLRIIMSFFQRYYTSIIGEKFTKNLRELLFSHQIDIKQSVYDEYGIGKYLLRYSGDLNSIKSFITVGVIRFCIDVFLLFLTFFIMLWISPLISFVLLIGAICTLAIVYFLNGYLYKYSLKLRNRKSGLLSYVNKNLLGILTIKAFNRYTISKKRFNSRSKKVYELSKKYQLINNLLLVLIPGFLYITLSIVLFAIYVLKENGSLHSLKENQLLAFILLFVTVLPVVRRTFRVSSKWKTGGLSFDKLITVLELPIEKGLEKDKLISYKKGILEFNSVCIKNENNDLLLDKISFVLQPNKIYLLSLDFIKNERKSLLIRLFLGIEVSYHGEIMFDGQDIQEVNIKDYRRYIAVVSPILPIYGRNVSEAVLYSRNNRRLQRADALLNLLQEGVEIHERIDLNTKLIENALNLSESQRWLIFFIRAFTTNKKIIIIDGMQHLKAYSFYCNLKKSLVDLKEKGRTIVVIDLPFKENIIDETIKL